MCDVTPLECRSRLAAWKCRLGETPIATVVCSSTYLVRRRSESLSTTAVSGIYSSCDNAIGILSVNTFLHLRISVIIGITPICESKKFNLLYTLMSDAIKCIFSWKMTIFITI